MAPSTGLLPMRTEPDSDRELKLFTLDRCDFAFDVLAGETARSVLLTVIDAPGTASDVAAAVGISVQNCAYHLNNLEEAELVTVVDTWYSSKGREMNVYGPVGEPLVLVLGDSDDALEGSDG